MTTTSARDQKRIVATIEGRVQGVGFRFFTRKQASELGVTGWVRNEPEGSVTVTAEGAHEQLEKLVEALKDGPATAVVEHFEVNWEEPSDDFSKFVIRR